GLVVPAGGRVALTEPVQGPRLLVGVAELPAQPERGAVAGQRLLVPAGALREQAQAVERGRLSAAVAVPAGDAEGATAVLLGPVEVTEPGVVPARRGRPRWRPARTSPADWARCSSVWPRRT